MRLGGYLAASALGALLATSAIAQTAPTHRPAAASTPSPSPQAKPQTSAGSEEQAGLVDINSAPAEELGRLPGIGSARAQAIIAARPYRGKDELVRRKVIPQNVYNQIKDKIVARQTSAKAPEGAGSPSPGGAKTK